MKDTALKLVFRQTGLLPRPAFYRDALFWFALLAGAVITVAMAYLLSEPRLAPAFTRWLLFSVLIWQPLLEEVFFRGIVQGQLLQRSWGRHHLAGVTVANVLSSVLFTAMHFMYHPPLWALAVFVPSLVFGYFRDRSGSIYPSFLLHALYNVFFVYMFW